MKKMTIQKNRPKAIIRKKRSSTHCPYKHGTSIVHGNIIIGNNSGNCGNSKSEFSNNIIDGSGNGVGNKTDFSPTTSPCSQNALEIDAMLKTLSFSQRTKAMIAFIDIVEKIRNE